MTTRDAARILVVDDEPQIHRFLKPALEAAGLAVLRADTAADALRLMATQSPELVLLDLGLPDMDGQEVLLRLRAFSLVPVIIVSAREREMEKVQALDAGADDYVEKPFALAELLARIRAALRRVAPAGVKPETLLRFGPLEVDLARRTARLDEQETLRLTPREWELLAALARAGDGRVVTQRHLLATVWGAAHLKDTQYLRVYVAQLRQKLGEAAFLIRTEPGVGYRFGEDP
ncbi:response regulator [Roseococcus suduntuyensis]|uniref:Two-component system KDP operon response regulator KdpE n=1 Tax=Roseococcus suduntuyensis TaxID=455361 RepID=A0A840A8T5_9PROT|nr:response regulator transcription factor [Roseococcus suduntuyensis]MBB3896734.1 two-component system KDP operon response regulator KdpE [Roseococcus suduntuyensis]